MHCQPKLSVSPLAIYWPLRGLHGASNAQLEHCRTSAQTPRGCRFSKRSKHHSPHFILSKVPPWLLFSSGLVPLLCCLFEVAVHDCRASGLSVLSLHFAVSIVVRAPSLDLHGKLSCQCGLPMFRCLFLKPHAMSLQRTACLPLCVASKCSSFVFCWVPIATMVSMSLASSARLSTWSAYRKHSGKSEHLSASSQGGRWPPLRASATSDYPCLFAVWSP